MTKEITEVQYNFTLYQYETQDEKAKYVAVHHEKTQISQGISSV